MDCGEEGWNFHRPTRRLCLNWVCIKCGSVSVKLMKFCTECLEWHDSHDFLDPDTLQVLNYCLESFKIKKPDSVEGTDR